MVPVNEHPVRYIWYYIVDNYMIFRVHIAVEIPKIIRELIADM